MQIVHILRHDDTFCVLPWSATDTISRIHGRLIGGGAGAEVSAPGFVARADCGRALLADRISARKSTEVRPVAGAGTRDEEAHVWIGLRKGGRRQNPNKR